MKTVIGLEKFWILFIYLAAVNLVAFFLYGVDKWKAKHSKWRVSEAVLIWMAVFGGSIGAWLGMKAWHHKTQHKKFKYGLPLILFVQIAAACCGMMLTACTSSEEQLKQRATELCAYVPDPEALERSREYMTADFYAVLDTMFRLPDREDVLHEWEFWFVATDGSPVARCACEVLSIERTDEAHVLAIIKVQPEDSNYEADEHRMHMERVNGKWLIADYDEHKADARRRMGG